MFFTACHILQGWDCFWLQWRASRVSPVLSSGRERSQCIFKRAPLYGERAPRTRKYAFAGLPLTKAGVVAGNPIPMRCPPPRSESAVLADDFVFRVIGAVACDNCIPQLVLHLDLQSGAFDRQFGLDITHADGFLEGHRVTA